jgi:hypothetical protein
LGECASRTAPLGLRPEPFGLGHSASVDFRGVRTMSAIAPGDLVVCVNADPIDCGMSEHTGNNIRVGQVRRVAFVDRVPICGCPGIFWGSDKRSQGALACRLRKLDKADEQFTETVRACRPIKRLAPVGRNPKGEDAQRLRAQHEHAVAAEGGQAPNLSSDLPDPPEQVKRESGR